MMPSMQTTQNFTNKRLSLFFMLAVCVISGIVLANTSNVSSNLGYSSAAVGVSPANPLLTKDLFAKLAVFRKNLASTPPAAAPASVPIQQEAKAQPQSQPVPPPQAEASKEPEGPIMKDGLNGIDYNNRNILFLEVQNRLAELKSNVNNLFSGERTSFDEQSRQIRDKLIQINDIDQSQWDQYRDQVLTLLREVERFPSATLVR